MSLFRKLNKILIVQSLFGLFPFKMNANNGKVEFCFFKWIYSIVVYGTISAASFYILINYTLRDFHAVFDNIAVTSKFLQIVNLEVVFAASIVGILFNRRKFVKFYNNLNAVDRKVERFRKPTDKSEKNLFHVYSLVFVFNFVLYFFVKLNLAAPVYLINSICVGLKIFALTLISLFIRSISSVLNNRMDIIVSTLGGMASGNFKKNIREIDECIRIFDELWHCKDSLSNVFGIHLLLFFCYDFIGMATFYYVLSTSFSYVVWPILPVLIKTLMYMVPYALKEVLVVVEMDKLGQQVNKLRCVIHKLYISDGITGSEDHLELIMLKLKHMERKKYVTANGFFSINYSILFNTVAAIVTFLLILLQFKQWEDNHLVPTSSSISLVY